MRNIIHVNNSSYVIFIFPVNNVKIKNQAENAKSTLIKSEFKSKLINLTWEDLLEFIDLITYDSEKLAIQMTDFKDKYKIKPNRQ